jgi:hypothetical protein
LRLPQSHRKPVQLEAPPLLETPEQVRRSIERDQALCIRAQREREKIAVERDRFELTRDRVYLGVELVLLVIVLLVAAGLWLTAHETAALYLLGSGGIGGGVGLLVRRRP